MFVYLLFFNIRLPVFFNNSLRLYLLCKKKPRCRNKGVIDRFVIAFRITLHIQDKCQYIQGWTLLTNSKFWENNTQLEKPDVNRIVFVLLQYSRLSL